jgi:hypothetical protein
MPAVIHLDPADRAMLDEALTRARALVAHLEEQKRELDTSPPTSLDAERLEEGRHAMIKAIASARRMLVSLEEAERIADAPDDPAPQGPADA